MTIKVTTRYTATCDYRTPLRKGMNARMCNNKISFTTTTTGNAIDLMKHYGWAVDRETGDCLCYQHAPKKDEALAKKKGDGDNAVLA